MLLETTETMEETKMTTRYRPLTCKCYKCKSKNFCNGNIFKKDAQIKGKYYLTDEEKDEELRFQYEKEIELKNMVKLKFTDER